GRNDKATPSPAWLCEDGSGKPMLLVPEIVTYTALLASATRTMHRRVTASGRGAWITSWNHGGDGMLVDHLAHCVLQQHHILVERLNLALQLDAVYQKDGNWNAFLSQSVEKRVL